MDVDYGYWRKYKIRESFEVGWILEIIYLVCSYLDELFIVYV